MASDIEVLKEEFQRPRAPAGLSDSVRTSPLRFLGARAFAGIGQGLDELSEPLQIQALVYSLAQPSPTALQLSRSYFHPHGA